MTRRLRTGPGFVHRFVKGAGIVVLSALIGYVGARHGGSVAARGAGGEGVTFESSRRAAATSAA